MQRPLPVNAFLSTVGLSLLLTAAAQAAICTSPVANCFDSGSCDDADPARCAVCAEGYVTNMFRSGDVDGTQCCSSDWCVACDDAHDGRCLECVPGFYLSDDGVCRVCDKPGCTCSASGEDCLSCDNIVADFYAGLKSFVTGVDGQARCCYPGCADCVAAYDAGSDTYDAYCTMCEPTHVFVSHPDGGQCISCSNYVIDCAECADYDGTNATCNSCDPGFRLDAESNTCEACNTTAGTGCGRCTADVGVCVACKLGHHAANDENGALIGCFACIADRCLQCQADILFCEVCEAAYTGTACGACADGYGGNPVEFCEPCPQFCATCDGEFQCTECVAGSYFTVTGACTPLLLPGGTCDLVKYPNHTDCGSAQCLDTVCCSRADENCVACSTEDGTCTECAAGFDVSQVNGTCAVPGSTSEVPETTEAPTSNETTEAPTSNETTEEQTEPTDESTEEPEASTNDTNAPDHNDTTAPTDELGSAPAVTVVTVILSIAAILA
jgi:hypothetical protein